MNQTSKNNFTLIFILALSLSCFGMICPGQEIAARKNIVTASGNLFRSANADYRQIYGQTVFMPEVKITRLVYRNISIWGSFSFIAKDGYIEEVDENTHIDQTMFGFGLGYAHKLSAKLRLRGKLGMTFISFKEEALAETAKGSGVGWKIGTNLDYFLSDKIFATVTTAYSGASDEAGAGKIKLGGFQAGIGLGFDF